MESAGKRLFLKLAAAFCCLLLAASGAAVASSTAATGQLISHSELMRLTPEKRAEYLAGVRALLIEVGRTGGPSRLIDQTAALDAQSRKTWLKLLESWIDNASAQAASSAATAASDAAVAKHLCNDSGECQREMLICFTDARPLIWLGGRYSCDAQRILARASEFTSAATRVEHYRKFLLDPKTHSAESLIMQTDAVSAINRPVVRLSQTAPETLAAAASKQRSRTKPIIGKLIDPSTVASARGSEALDAICQAEAKRLDTKEKLTLAPLAKDNAGKVTAFACMNASAAEQSGRSDLKYLVPKELLLAASSKPASPRATSTLSCEPPQNVCVGTHADRAKKFQAAAGADPQSCIFAGMISTIRTDARKCEAVLEFTWAEGALKCEAGQTLCNPLLFGARSATEGICVGRGQNATATCASLSSARDADHFVTRNQAGIKERWDEFRAALTKACDAKTASGEFHCSECNTIRLRLFELHARLVGDPCTAANPIDAVGTAIKSGTRK